MGSEPRVLPLHLADIHLPEGERWPPATPFPLVAHAVVHRDGVFLFDTGIGGGNAEVQELYSPERFPLEGALAAHGVDLADVTAAANCHLHIDHGGQNGLLPGRPIFVQRREWAMVHELDYTIPEWIDVSGLTYEVIEGEAEVAPGLRVIPTPGHTPGHQSLVIESPGGRVVVAGQAVLTLAEWEGSTEPVDSGVPVEEGDDHDAYVASVGRLRALDPVAVHFVHDPAVWERPA